MGDALRLDTGRRAPPSPRRTGDPPSSPWSRRRHPGPFCAGPPGKIRKQRDAERVPAPSTLAAFPGSLCARAAPRSPGKPRAPAAQAGAWPPGRGTGARAADQRAQGICHLSRPAPRHSSAGGCEQNPSPALLSHRVQSDSSEHAHEHVVVNLLNNFPSRQSRIAVRQGRMPRFRPRSMKPDSRRRGLDGGAL